MVPTCNCLRRYVQTIGADFQYAIRTDPYAQNSPRGESPSGKPPPVKPTLVELCSLSVADASEIVVGLAVTCRDLP